MQDAAQKTILNVDDHEPGRYGIARVLRQAQRPNYPGNRLEEDGAICWKAGGSVSLVSVGKAPGLGALEFGIVGRERNPCPANHKPRREP